MTKDARRKLRRSAEHTFSASERPLYTEYGRQLLPHLVRLGVANRREVERVIAVHFPDQLADNIKSNIDAMVEAQKRRAIAPEKRVRKGAATQAKRAYAANKR